MRPRLYKRRGSGLYYGSYGDKNGQRVRRSTGTTDRAAAEAVLGRWVGAATAADPPGDDAAQRQTGKPGGHTLHDALAHFMHFGLQDVADGTKRCYRQRGGHLVRLLGGIDVAELHMDHLHWYFAERLRELAARESIKKETCVLRQALRLAHERGIVGADPAGRIPRFRARYEPRRRWLTPDEAGRLLAVLPPPRRFWVEVVLYTGARSGEVERLDYKHVSFRDRLVYLPGTKTPRAARTLPLHPALARLLLRQPVRCGPVVQKWGNVRRDLALACKRAEIATVTPNDLRRTFASWLKQRGVESFKVAKLLGHTSTRMVEMVYGHLDGGTMAAALDELPELRPAPPARKNQPHHPTGRRRSTQNRSD